MLLPRSQEVFIPLQPHFLALQGFGKLLETVALVNQRINSNLRVTGILLCMFDAGPRFQARSRPISSSSCRMPEAATAHGRRPDRAGICPQEYKTRRSSQLRQNIFEYEQECNGAQDYQQVADYIHAMNQDPAAQTIIAQPPVAAC